MTRQHAAEFRKMETEFKRDMTTIGNQSTFSAEDVMRWLADPRNVGKRFGWTLMKVGYEQAGEPKQPEQTRDA